MNAEAAAAMSGLRLEGSVQGTRCSCSSAGSPLYCWAAGPRCLQLTWPSSRVIRPLGQGWMSSLREVPLLPQLTPGSGLESVRDGLEFPSALAGSSSSLQIPVYFAFPTTALVTSGPSIRNTSNKPNMDFKQSMLPNLLKIISL